jgi:hypothetical protein
MIPLVQPYTLGYLNKNGDLHFMEFPSFDVCKTIPEDLIFVAIRQEFETIFDPPLKFPFTNIERCIIGLRGSFDMSFVKESDYRKQNSKFCPFDIDDTPQPLVLSSWIGAELSWNYFRPVQVWCIDNSDTNPEWVIFSWTDYTNSATVGNDPNYNFKLYDATLDIYSNVLEYSAD